MQHIVFNVSVGAETLFIQLPKHRSLVSIENVTLSRTRDKICLHISYLIAHRFVLSPKKSNTIMFSFHVKENIIA